MRGAKRPAAVGWVTAVVAILAMTAADAARAALPSDAAGVPFVTFARATAAGDFPRACDQLAAAALESLGGPRSSAGRLAERAACVRALRSDAAHLDRGLRRSLATTRVVAVQVRPGRARVTVETTLYGVKPRATGTAIVERGRWRIAEPPAEARVGSSLVMHVDAESMRPALRGGDTILVDTAAYLESRPRVGDIVVFHPPAGALRRNPCARRPAAGQACATATRSVWDMDYVKRIVGVPGDRISIRNGYVIRNGQRAREFVIPCKTRDGCDFPRPLTVRAGNYYVLGDNRGDSDDSRYWGPVAASQIVGRVRRLGP